MKLRLSVGTRFDLRSVKHRKFPEEKSGTSTIASRVVMEKRLVFGSTRVPTACNDDLVRSTDGHGCQTVLKRMGNKKKKQHELNERARHVFWESEICARTSAPCAYPYLRPLLPCDEQFFRRASNRGRSVRIYTRSTVH